MEEFDVRWRNYRGFSDTGKISLKPLTVIIGPNNAGKTSLHSPLLLLKQTLASPDETVGLVTNGPLFSVGQFVDMIHGHNTARTLSLAIRFRSAEESSGTRLRPLGFYPPGSTEVTFRDAPPGEPILLHRYRVWDEHERLFIARRRSADGGYAVESPLGRSRAADAVRSDQPSHFLFSATGPLSTLFDPEARSRPKPFPERVRDYVAAVAFVEQAITSRLDSLSYVGPLRERPRRLYELSGAMPVDVGVAGGHAPELLYRRRRDELLDEVRYWLQQFDLPRHVKFREQPGAFSLELARLTRDKPTNIADMGFGVSQVLPLIVQGLLAEGGSTMIAEQPEIHLNPRLQAELADLFVAVRKRDVRVVVETHSEHLLLRLRRLIAEEHIAHNDVALYFVTSAEGQSSVREVMIDAHGHIEKDEWPTGFFRETLDDALALASAQRNRQRD